MSLLRVEEGLGLRMVKDIYRDAIVKSAWRIWNDDCSLWCLWMRLRYVKNHMLEVFERKNDFDSILWVELLNHREHILQVHENRFWIDF